MVVVIDSSCAIKNIKPSYPTSVNDFRFVMGSMYVLPIWINFYQACKQLF